MLYTIIVPIYIPIITALIALIGVILTAIVGWWNNKKQFNGLVVSQSRINWIQEVRKHAAVYLSHMSNCKSILEQIESSNQSITDLRKRIKVYDDIWYPSESEEPVDYEVDCPGHEDSNKTYRKNIADLYVSIKKSSKLLIEEQDKFNENFQLLTLYLPKNPKKSLEEDDHAQLLSMMNELKLMISDGVKNKENVNAVEFKGKVNKFTNKISNYLKQEWDEAKKNK
ncbi:hypothetical protein [Salinicoccus sediminis]|nr:hypothetical protein [Salinicoccus sediminis]